jgi:hypothetical protein
MVMSTTLPRRFALNDTSCRGGVALWVEKWVVVCFGFSFSRFYFFVWQTDVASSIQKPFHAFTCQFFRLEERRSAS